MAATSNAPFSFSSATPPAAGRVDKSPPKGLVNPLLSKSPAPFQQAPVAGNAAAARGLSETNNDGLRQRRKSSEAKDKASTKSPFPHKLSLTMGGGFAGALDDSNKVMGGSSNVTQTPWTSPLETADDTDEAFDRYVVVYGYATAAQYEAILRRFETYGKIVNRHGVCRPGMSNWVALQYESPLQAEKALSQQNTIIMNGILVGVMRMDASLKESLDWNATAPPLATPTGSEGVSPPGKQRLDGVFRDSMDQTTNGRQDRVFRDSMGQTTNGREFTEEDVLLLGRESESRARRDGVKPGPCDRFIRWCYGWNSSSSGVSQALTQNGRM